MFILAPEITLSVNPLSKGIFLPEQEDTHKSLKAKTFTEIKAEQYNQELNRQETNVASFKL